MVSNNSGRASNPLGSYVVVFWKSTHDSFSCLIALSVAEMHCVSNIYKSIVGFKAIKLSMKDKILFDGSKTKTVTLLCLPFKLFFAVTSACVWFGYKFKSFCFSDSSYVNSFEGAMCG